MLPRDRRLDRLSFVQTRQHGKIYHHPFFTLVISLPRPPHRGFTRISVVTSSKINKSAVIRNRLRRRIYSSLDQSTGGYSLIVYPKIKMLNLTREEISSVLNSFLSEIDLA